MSHIQDLWWKEIEDPDGDIRREKTERFGKGMRYKARYIDPSGDERSKSFPDKKKKEAQDFLTDMEGAKLKGTYIDPNAGKITFQAYAENWVKIHDVDESTRELIEIRLRKHVFPVLGTRQLSSVKPDDIRSWDHDLKSKLAPSTRAVAFAFVRSIFATAVDDEKIGKSPFSVKSVKQPRPVTPDIIPWLPEMAAGVRASMPNRYLPVFDLGLGCGMRLGEILGLGLDEIDLESNEIHVRRQVKIVRNRPVFGLPKNDSDRYIPLPDAVAVKLKQHLGDYSPLKITLPWEKPDSDEAVTVPLVIFTARAHVVRRSHFYKDAWHPALAKAGISRGRMNGPHALRHLYASVLLDAGENIKALARFLGHSDPAFTLRQYTHFMPASETRSRQAVNAFYHSTDGLETA